MLALYAFITHNQIQVYSKYFFIDERIDFI